MDLSLLGIYFLAALFGSFLSQAVISLVRVFILHRPVRPVSLETLMLVLAGYGIIALRHPREPGIWAVLVAGAVLGWWLWPRLSAWLVRL